MSKKSNVRILESVATRLRARGDKAGEMWLWCMHCERFFQAKDLQEDFLGNRQRCAFDDCGAAGFDVDIFGWNDWKHPGGPRNERQLKHGMHGA